MDESPGPSRSGICLNTQGPVQSSNAFVSDLVLHLYTLSVTLSAHIALCDRFPWRLLEHPEILSHPGDASQKQKEYITLIPDQLSVI